MNERAEAPHAQLARILDPEGFSNLDGRQWPNGPVSDWPPAQRADFEAASRRVAASRAQGARALAAGWRPPVAVVTTPEGLDALPNLTVIRTSRGSVMEKWSGSRWHCVGVREVCPRPALPAIVVWEPPPGGAVRAG